MEEKSLETNNNFNNVDSSFSVVSSTTPSVSNDQSEEEILELHTSPEIEMLKKFNPPKHGLRVEKKCDSCKRNPNKAIDALVRKFQPQKFSN